MNQFDVIIDLRCGPHTMQKSLLESLIVADEGTTCTYNIWLSNEPADPKFDTILVEFLKQKTVNILPELHYNNYEFPQNVIASEYSSEVSENSQQRLMAKKAWFEQNLYLHSAIEMFDQFVYLTPATIPVAHNWLFKLLQISSKSNLPVISSYRRLLIDEVYFYCGWASYGWFNGKELRKLPLSKYIEERIENPWSLLGNFNKQKTGAGFCLKDKWLSMFDVPIDYLIFALYFSNSSTKENPIEWSDKCDNSYNSLLYDNSNDDGVNEQKTSDESIIIFDRIGNEKLISYNLRKLYRQTAFNNFDQQKSIFKLSHSDYPLGGPKWNLLARNKINFELAYLKNLYQGERCFIIGNGPSIKNTDLSILKNEYTIGLNRIYLNYENMGYQPSFLCITNPNVTEQFAAEIDLLDSIKFLTSKSYEIIKNKWNTYFMKSRGVHEFYEDLSDMVWSEGCTVTFCAMQVAYYLGFDTVILVGVDHNFTNSGTPHQLVEADSEDENHFHPEYFGKGVKWQYPDLPASEVSYNIAKGIYTNNNKKIFDATIGGKLKVFQKVDYKKVI